MDTAAAAAAACAGSPSGKKGKGKEKGGSTLISSFSFTSMINSRWPVAQRGTLALPVDILFFFCPCWCVRLPSLAATVTIGGKTN